MKLIDASPQVSLAVAIPVSNGSVGPEHSTVLSLGQVITGGVVSTIVIFCTQLALLPQASVAVQVRVITPLLPQPGTNVSLNVTVASVHASVPVAIPVAAGSVAPVHSTVLSAGHVITGGTVSLTATSIVQIIEQLLLSTFNVKLKF
jgi:hypothetical protein